MKSHVIKKLSDVLIASTEDNRLRYKLQFDRGCKSKIINFCKGDYIKPHKHSEGKVVKFIVRGRLLYGLKDGNEPQVFEAGEIATVEKDIIYDSLVVEDTELILWEELNSEIISQ